MVELGRSWRAAVGAAWVALMGAGCAMVPKSKLDDCHRESQAVQIETSQLKDAAVRLRDQNRDYAQRAVDDARRLRTLEEANARLEASVLAYQEDVRRMEAAVDRISRTVQATGEVVR